MTITNPPYSLKDKFLARAFSLKKPFMFLLPTTSLEGLKRGKMFRENKIQLLVPDRRFNFKSEKSSGAWFHTSWFTYGLGLKNDLYHISIEARDKSWVQTGHNAKNIINLNDDYRKAA
jgi:hypothetical protein